jgi:hypothetical protein
MQRVSRFARYWEMIGNSGRFSRACILLLGDAPFARFMRFADWVYASTGKTHEIALERLFEHVYLFMTRELGIDAALAQSALLADYEASGARGYLTFMPERAARSKATALRKARSPLRQVRHLQP